MATKRTSAPRAKKSASRGKAPKPPAKTTGATLPFEIDPKKIEESLGTLRENLSKWARKGRYTKVRFKFRGKSLLPDVPLAAVLAVEGITFYWTGLLRALVFNLAGKTVFEVELVNDSEKQLTRGKEALLSGDLDEAFKNFSEAIAMDHDNPAVHLNLGIALKLKGDHPAARSSFTTARKLDPEGPTGAEADRLLATLRPEN